MTEELLAVGRITRAHGVRGELSVQPLTEVPGRFEPGVALRLGPDGERTLTVRSARPHHDRLLLTFHEVPDRSAAEGLLGRELLIAAEESPQLPADSFWVHEVVGLDVQTEDGTPLGRVHEVIATAGNDVWVVRGERESLIPAIRDVVISVDLEARRAVIRPMPGLLEGDEA